MSNYKYYQPNKKDIKDNYSDCVVRALTKVMSKSWLEIFDELIPIAREIQCMPNNRICWREYLKRNGFIYQGIKRGTKRPTIKQFAEKHKHGTYVLKIAEHIVACVDGIYYDTFDCGNHCICSYMEKEDNDDK